MTNDDWWGPTHNDPAAQEASLALLERAYAVNDALDLAAFVRAVGEHFSNYSRSEWENLTIPDYLGSMSGWIADHHRHGEHVPELRDSSGVPWSVVARIIAAGAFYE